MIFIHLSSSEELIVSGVVASGSPYGSEANTPGQSSQAEPFISDLALKTRISILN